MLTTAPTSPIQSIELPHTIPPLCNGDRLTRAEFERRYEAMPHVKKAELIEGIVYMPSPVRFGPHAQPHATLISWIGYYVSKTPGLLTGGNATDRLDEDNEPQPDVLLMLPEHAGGAAKIDEDDYVNGPPELVCEVAASSVSIDLHIKKNVYRRNGVKEYLVWRTGDRAIDWFALRESEYHSLPLGSDGLIRSGIFPGLWLDPVALLDFNLSALFAGVDRGIAESEHAAFLRRAVV